VNDSEDTAQSASSPPSGSAAPAARKRRTRARRKTATGASKPTRGSATAASRRSAPSRKKPASRRRRKSARPAGYERFLSDLARRANRAGSTIADLSEGGADAARRTIGKVTAGSKKTIARVKREWDQMDTAKRAGFVAALLAALAAASASVARATKK